MDRLNVRSFRRSYVNLAQVYASCQRDLFVLAFLEIMLHYILIFRELNIKCMLYIKTNTLINVDAKKLLQMYKRLNSNLPTMAGK